MVHIQCCTITAQPRQNPRSWCHSASVPPPRLPVFARGIFHPHARDGQSQPLLADSAGVQNNLRICGLKYMARVVGAPFSSPHRTTKITLGPATLGRGQPRRGGGYIVLEAYRRSNRSISGEAFNWIANRLSDVNIGPCDDSSTLIRAANSRFQTWSFCRVII